MTFVEQQKRLLCKLSLRHDRTVRQRVFGRTGEAERFAKQGHRAVGGTLFRQGNQQNIQRECVERVEQVVGQILPQHQPEIRKGLVQPRQQQRQNIRTERRDDAEAQHAGECPMPVADQCGDLVRLLQDAARVLNHTFPDWGEGYEPRGALHQRHAEPLFQLP